MCRFLHVFAVVVSNVNGCPYFFREFMALLSAAFFEADVLVGSSHDCFADLQFH